MKEHKLLDYLKTTHGLKNDAALAKFLHTDPSYVSRIRVGKLSFGAELIVDLHLETGMEIKDIKAMLT